MPTPIFLGMIILLMAVLPAASVVIEAVWTTDPDIVALIGRWFVFWAVGVRLFLAGLRQTLTPAFTAESIFEIHDPKARTIVQELGFGTLSIGAVGILSILDRDWVMPAAIVGGLFYGLAGIKHVFNRHQTRLETIATVSDLFIFGVLGLYVIVTLIQHGI